MNTSDLIYLDYQATTPCDPRVVEAMAPFWSQDFGNPASRSHRFGTGAKHAVEDARSQIAQLINASPKEIIWTSGATESNNLALFGAIENSTKSPAHVISIATEHPSVLEPLSELEKRGHQVTILGVDAQGFISLSELKQAITDRTVLISVMAANNEIGVLQDLKQIGMLCRKHQIIFHTDAAQAVGKIPLDVQDLNIDLLSISGHKLYAPKGIGALFVRRGRPRIRLTPRFFGGGHERGLRAGTLPVPLIVGLGKAAEIASGELSDTGLASLQRLREHLWLTLDRRLDGVHLNGPASMRLPNNLNVSFDGVDSETLIIALSRLAISTGSACSSEALKPSHVLAALGHSHGRIHGSIRIGLGRFTTSDEINVAADLIVNAVTEIRSFNESPLGSTNQRDSLWVNTAKK